MRRYLFLHFSNFAVDCARRSEDRLPPRVVLVREARGTQWVASCSPQACAEGVQPGMRLAQARSLIGQHELAVRAWDPHANQKALEQRVDWAQRFSPLVALVPADGLVLEIAGSERMFGGEKALVAAVARSSVKSGFGLRAAVADTIGCARALARYAPAPVPTDGLRVPSGEELEALAPLPVEALDLEAQTVDALHEVGVQRIAGLLELPRDGLPARFGADLLLRLDQATGRAFEAFQPVQPTRPVQAEHEFEAPVELEVVRRMVRELLGELVRDLKARTENARRVDLVLVCAHAAPVRERVVLSHPSADFDHLWSLLDPRLERVPLGFGAERIVLALPETVAASARQTRAWSAEENARAHLGKDLGELIDTLIGRLGESGVQCAEPVASHLPERAFRVCSSRAKTGASTRAVTPHARPSRLFDRPEAIVVELDGDGRPARFRWRGGERRVVRRFGPERIGAEWWRDTAGTRGARDYYRLEDDRGRWLWIGRDSRDRWFVHGEWA